MELRFGSGEVTLLRILCPATMFSLRKSDDFEDPLPCDVVYKTLLVGKVFFFKILTFLLPGHAVPIASLLANTITSALP